MEAIHLAIVSLVSPSTNVSRAYLQHTWPPDEVVDTHASASVGKHNMYIITLFWSSCFLCRIHHAQVFIALPEDNKGPNTSMHSPGRSCVLPDEQPFSYNISLQHVIYIRHGETHIGDKASVNTHD